MDNLLPLSAVFVSHVPSRGLAELLASAPPSFEELLDGLWHEAAARWTGFVVAAPLFVQHVAERTADVKSYDELTQWLKGLAAADLYLACGCMHGEDAAIRAFDKEVISRVPAFVSQQRLPAAFVDDVQQELRRKLLVSHGEKDPGIAGYGGRGELQNFVRATAVRTAISMRRPMDEKNQRDDGSVAERLSGATADPALESMKKQYRTEFKEALSSAIATLTSEQRNLLRMYYVDGVPTTQLATVFKLNQSNVSRRISAARTAIFDETKRQLRGRLKLTDSSFEELSQMVQSQLDLSLSRLLR